MDEKIDARHIKGKLYEGDPPETIIVRHVPSTQFISDFATGVTISGSTVENLYYLTFFSDVTAINSEMAELLDDNPDGLKQTFPGYRINVNPDGIENIREDKARIALSSSALRSLRELLNTVKFDGNI